MRRLIAITLLLAGFATWAKFQQGPAPATAAQLANATDLQNCSVTAASATNTLVISLKDGAGSDPSSSSACKIAFRNATAGTGTFSTVSATSAISFTISNGSALGCTASAQCVLYVYAINNAGTIVLGAINGSPFDEGSVQSSTAEGGAGAADSMHVMYSTAAQSNKAVRLLARLTVTPGGSHAWSAAPSEISNVPFAEDGWFINASFTGDNPDLGVSAVTSYTEMTAASMTLTPITGSAAVGTMCATTNAATAPALTATTCAAGNESAGINFALPRPGTYEVCVTTTISAGLDSGEAASPAFQLIETPTNAQTLTLQSGSITQVNLESAAADQDAGTGPSLCGWFNWKHKAAGTVVGVRLMYEMSIAGAPDYVLVIADADANNGQRNMNWRVRQIR